MINQTRKVRMISSPAYPMIEMVRESMGLSTDKFAQWIGIDRRTYTGYQRGEHKIPADVVAKLARTVAVKPECLVGSVH